MDKAAKKPTAKRQAFGEAGGEMCLILDFVLHGLILCVQRFNNLLLVRRIQLAPA